MIHRNGSVRVVREHLRVGDLLLAYDKAEAALRRDPDNPELRYLAVLALARAGSLRHAQAEHTALRIDEIARDPGAPDILRQDAASLGARILKDLALSMPSAARGRALGLATMRYEANHTRWGGHYAASNVVFLRALQGDPGGAREWARVVIACAEPVGATAEAAEERCWAWASIATARLALGEAAAAVAALQAAQDADPRNLGAHAATRRQARRMCDATNIELGPIGAALDAPVVAYTGHIVTADAAGRFPAALTAAARDAIGDLVARRPPVAGFGGLAAGGDILFAEALLARGAELHIVLPFAEADYIRLSVEPSGGDWLGRYAACIAAATSRRPSSDARV